MTDSSDSPDEGASPDPESAPDALGSDPFEVADVEDPEPGIGSPDGPVETVEPVEIDETDLPDPSVETVETVDPGEVGVEEPAQIADSETPLGAGEDEATSGEIIDPPIGERTAGDEPVVEPAGEMVPGATEPPVPSIWPIWAWTMVAVVLVVIGLGLAVGVLAKTLLLDVVSFWPAFVVIALVFAALIPRLRRGAPRLSAVLPLLLLTYLGVTVALHVARWDQLPSTAADVPGPEVGVVTDGRIELDLGGSLVLGPADQAELYRVSMMKRGGGTGAPTALEIVDGSAASVTVSERDDSGWFQSDGWLVQLSLGVTWEVVATADRIDINLASVSAGDVTVHGDGTVALGFVRPGSVITLDGKINLLVRDGDHIELVGKATVPDDWSTTGLGRSTPGPSDSFTIIVTDSATVTVGDRK